MIPEWTCDQKTTWSDIVTYNDQFSG
ncbi:uncharacterized protein METZ01_LOCUS200227 [marine metagenome]|uniref:Uncharacterized protein n=1 Tax=marine metagenome TaxID=408172 RepID=A0A382EBP8_9ZZZZ